MSKSILGVWATGHCGLPYNELVDNQSKLGSAETQPDNALDKDTPRALIRHFCHLPPIQYEWQKEVYTFLPYEQNKTSVFKTFCTIVAPIRSGHQPAHRHWQHLVVVSEDATCRLRGEEVKFSRTHMAAMPGSLGGTTPQRPRPYDGRSHPPSAKQL